MYKNIKTIEDINLKDKKVLVRVDFNVPMKNKEVTSNKRIVASLKTINYLIEKEAKIILFSHLGRIKKEEDKRENSLEPISKELSKLLNKEVLFSKGTSGKNLELLIDQLNSKDILLIENTRFEDFPKKLESNNDQELGKYWASLGDVFINDAFGASHRAHASNVGIATYIKESAIGFLIQHELLMLSKALYNPQRPVVSIVGGAKVSDKIDVIENFVDIADKIIIGGGMSYTFVKAQGFNIGKSLFEEETFSKAKNLLEKYSDKIHLPLDYATNDKFEDTPPLFTKDKNIDDNYEGMDIGPKTIENIDQLLKGAKTVIWNGPMGVTEFKNFSVGTNSVAKMISNLEGVYSVVGGGDSAAAIIKLGYEDKFSFISTGGGASLDFMSGKKLPGIEAIERKE